jgi:selenocysteine lyase/cysteine desulfurase
MIPLDCQREAFSIPDDVHYLNCAYMGPLPRAAQQAGIAAIGRKAVPTSIEARDFFTESDRARSLFADLIGATEPARVALVPSVSYGMAVVARNLRLEPGSTIITAAEQFPSNVYAWRRLAARCGAELIAVPAPAGPERGAAWNAALLAAIDARTALVALPQVHWTDGTRFDLAKIGAAARSQGAAFVIDATQSVGAMPFDVNACAADAVVVAGYKWLLGPYGLGYLWLGSRFDDGEPLEETWIGRGGSEDFRGLVAYRDDYQPGAARFDMGERSNFILLPMAIAALERIREWRTDRIQDYCARLMRPAIEAAASMGFTVEDEHWRGSHLFGLRAPPGLDLAELDVALKEGRVSASLRGSALRVSPNVYNDDADAAALVAALEAGSRSRFSARGTSEAAPSTPRVEGVASH